MTEHAGELLAIIDEQQNDLYRVRVECAALRVECAALRVRVSDALKDRDRWLIRVAKLEHQLAIIKRITDPTIDSDLWELTGPVEK